MTSVNRVYELYDLMAKRCRMNKYTSHQAKTYAEIRDFIATCSSVDESLVKIKNSPYYTAAAQAVMLDKMDAYRKAAKDNKQPELEAIYSEKYKEIEGDYLKAFEGGYEKKVLGVEKKCSDLTAAFTGVYNAYIEMLCTSFDKTKIRHLQSDLKKAFDVIERNGETFEGLSNNEYFKSLIPANSIGFKEFVDEAPVLLKTGIDNSKDEAEFKAEFDKEWSAISSNKTRIMEVGKGELSRARNGAAVAVPPADRKGKYTFELVEEEVL